MTITMARILTFFMVISFMFASSAAHASKTISTADLINAQAVELMVLPAITHTVVDQLAAAAGPSSPHHENSEHDLASDECPCKHTQSKSVSLVCGVVLALGGSGADFIKPVSLIVTFDRSSNPLPSAFIDSLKRPPRFFV